MLSSADRPIEQVIELLAARNVDCGFLVPTATALDHKILDAHIQLRDYLRSSGFHDYDLQTQGPAAKLVRECWLVGVASVEKTRVSLYRPASKSGDPRIWISSLDSYSKPGNLLAVFAFGDALYVVNASVPGLLESCVDSETPLGKLVQGIAALKDAPAVELLAKLRGIASGGFVQTLRDGPTGVGMTLETLLGIPANSSRAPDFRGIELKASRTTPTLASKSRVSLFAQAPEWRESPVGSAMGLLSTYGYLEAGRLQLYCSMNHRPNSLGFSLSVNSPKLHALHGRQSSATKVLQWDLERLKNALLEKHQQTFWVKAHTTVINGREHFRYVSAFHTRAPIAANFEPLIESGHIEADFALHAVSGRLGMRARDHGYLFKMWPKNLHLLFPPSVEHSLC
jgi:hypothetical protein